MNNLIHHYNQAVITFRFKDIHLQHKLVKVDVKFASGNKCCEISGLAVKLGMMPVLLKTVEDMVALMKQPTWMGRMAAPIWSPLQ